MGCGSSADAQVANTAPQAYEVPKQEQKLDPAPTPLPPKIEAEPPAPKTTTFSQVHSAIRWGKPISEIDQLLKIEGASILTDPQSGNYPIHIASQNGHLEIVQHLVNVYKTDVNVKNFQGNTPLHMAIEYDYLDTAQFLIQNSASKNISNRSGKVSGKGIEGTKCVEILSFVKAETEKEILVALDDCEAHVADIDKSSFISVGLKKKKGVGPQWTDEVQAKFKHVLELAA